MKPDTRNSYEARILRVLVHIQANLDEALSLDELAAIACFSPHHFHRVFGAMVGESLKQHVRRLRLERAACRLRFTDERVTAIAFAAGYETHEAFTRAFRDLFGESPSGFRKQRRPPTFPAAPTDVHFRDDRAPEHFHPVHQGETPMSVRIASIDPIRVAFLRHVGPYENAWPTWVRMLGWAEEQGLGGNRRFGISHDDPEITDYANLRHDACIEVPASFQPEGEIGVQEIAGGDYAVTTHAGPYERLHEAYAHLYGQWLPASGREPRAAPPFEQMIRMPTDTPSEALVTDIYLPLAARS